MHYLICYDIGNDKIRTALAKLLARHQCERVQLSVFLSGLISKKQYAALSQAVSKLLQKKLHQTDSIIIIPMSLPILQTAVIIGDSNCLETIINPPLYLLL